MFMDSRIMACHCHPFSSSGFYKDRDIMAHEIDVPMVRKTEMLTCALIVGFEIGL